MAPGTYAARLTVTDDRGAQASDAAVVHMADYSDNRSFDTSNTGLKITITIGSNADLGIDGFVGTVTGGDFNDLSVDADAGTLASASVATEAAPSQLLHLPIFMSPRFKPLSTLRRLHRFRQGDIRQIPCQRGAR